MERSTLQAASASGNATRAEGLLIAFAARRALDRGLSLGYLEAQLRLRFGDDQPTAVKTIIDTARAPITLDQLRRELHALAPQPFGPHRQTGGRPGYATPPQQRGRGSVGGGGVWWGDIT